MMWEWVSALAHVDWSRVLLVVEVVLIAILCVVGAMVASRAFDLIGYDSVGRRIKTGKWVIAFVFCFFTLLSFISAIPLEIRRAATHLGLLGLIVGFWATWLGYRRLEHDARGTLGFIRRRDRRSE